MDSLDDLDTIDSLSWALEEINGSRVPLGRYPGRQAYDATRISPSTQSMQAGSIYFLAFPPAYCPTSFHTPEALAF